MKADLISDEALARINRAIANVKTPMGAYCIGIVSALAWQVGKMPPPTVLEAAGQCVDINDAIDWYRLTEMLRDARLVS